MPEDRTNKISCSHYTCEVEVGVEILSGKWVALILWHMRDGEPRRFGELRRLLSGVTQKMLTQQLRMLEQNGIVSRTVLPHTPPSVEYRLTAIGQALMPVLQALHQWSRDFLDQRQQPDGGASPFP